MASPPRPDIGIAIAPEEQRFIIYKRHSQDGKHRREEEFRRLPSSRPVLQRRPNRYCRLSPAAARSPISARSRQLCELEGYMPPHIHALKAPHPICGLGRFFPNAGTPRSSACTGTLHRKEAEWRAHRVGSTMNCTKESKLPLRKTEITHWQNPVLTCVVC